jgi:hypothetical protein
LSDRIMLIAVASCQFPLPIEPSQPRKARGACELLEALREWL